jgi:acyl-CoA synthetase (AMP-forming)/AMP-acid ligase II
VLDRVVPKPGQVDPFGSLDGAITVPDGLTLTSYFDRNRDLHGDSPAYRFLDYSQEPDGRPVVLSWNQLWTRVCSIGARLQQVTRPGDRVAILAPQGLDYVAAFFGAVYAGNIAVPLFAPTMSGHAERLAAVLGDARPAAVLTTTTVSESVRTFIRTLAAAERPRMIAVDALPETLGSMFSGAALDTDDIAYLQYTSGSTRSPAGVEITHRSVYTNAMQMVVSGGLDVDVRTVSWLPLFHDMGLMMIMFTAFFGAHVTIMDPMAFLRRPYRWIKQLGIESTFGRTFAAAPNFAFELTSERGLPPAGETLDLSNVVCILNGSEPVTMSAVEKFTNAFAPYGLPSNAVKPSYGMAEATLSVASISQDASASAIYLDREALGSGRAVIVAPDHPSAVSQVSCGQPIPDQWAVIVDADGVEVPDATVGEIWLQGNNIGRGYFGREAETRRVFGNKLQSRLEVGSHAEGAADNGYWLATGDLGVYLDGELYLTGRIKDLIIIDGRNHYPFDIETTVSDSSPAVRTGYVAAFSVPADARQSADGGSGEQLVVLAERAAGAGRTDLSAIADTVRAAISRNHQVRVADVRLVAAGTIPRTTSGKLARSAARTEYLAGKFNR